jgi:DNA-binding MarR family transcriptional regulator
MEEKGLIIRKKNPDDGRGVLIYLTELGKEKRLIKSCFKIRYS